MINMFPKKSLLSLKKNYQLIIIDLPGKNSGKGTFDSEAKK